MALVARYEPCHRATAELSGDFSRIITTSAIYRACTLRFRSILMTTMAALLGSVPLMLGTGTGSEIGQPFGYSIVGGLMLSQLLTLYTTPVVHLYLDRLATKSRRLRGARRGFDKKAGSPQPCGMSIVSAAGSAAGCR